MPAPGSVSVGVAQMTAQIRASMSAQEAASAPPASTDSIGSGMPVVWVSRSRTRTPSLPPPVNSGSTLQTGVSRSRAPLSQARAKAIAPSGLEEQVQGTYVSSVIGAPLPLSPTARSTTWPR